MLEFYDKTKNPYENAGLEDMPDMLLRPGGFELTRRLIELSGIAPGSRIVDIGCGTGSAASFLAGLGFDVTGVDKSADLIERGGTPMEIPLIKAAAENLPFEDALFDAVLFECSLSLTDACAALSEAGRVLKHEGTLLISDVFSDASQTIAAGISLRSETELFELLRQNGFEPETCEDRTGVFKTFAAQLIMSTGSLNALFDCREWLEIKNARPRYCLITARKIGVGQT